jgi:flagellar protein FlaG
MEIKSMLPAVSPPVIAPVSPELAAEQREIIKAVKAINAAELFGEHHELTFAFDRETRRPVVRIVDRKTHEVVRQIPNEQALRIFEGLKSALE